MATHYYVELEEFKEGETFEQIASILELDLAGELTPEKYHEILEI